MLEAAMDRRYSASPEETFFTGGGEHRFHNFDKSDNSRILSVREGFRKSVNLVFIRLMRDIVHYYMYRVPGSTARILADVKDPARQAYLARFSDLDGLTTAGRRYREVLAARPGDAVALAMKAEILKRATVVGLSMLPRSAPPSAPGRWKRVSLLLLASWLGSTLAYVLWKLING
jgi:hypothetical protein